MSGAASLRRSLFARLLGPLLAVVAFAALASWAIAQYYSREVLDQWLHDSAITLAKQVRFVAGDARIDIGGQAIEMFEVDATDRVYYEVTSRTQGRILSNASLPPSPAEVEGPDPVFYDGFVEGQPVRVIALALAGPGGEPVQVKVAETRRKRDQLARHILVSTLALLAALVVTAGALIRRGIGSGLESLERIVRQVRERPGPLLAPVELGQDVPNEVRPLLDAINGLLRELEAEHAGRQRFIADAAHQLRTPIASLGVKLSLASREPDPARMREAIDAVLARLPRTTHLVRQLLALARVDQNTPDAQAPVPVDLAKLAREEVEAWADRFIAKEADLGLEAPAHAVVVTGQPLLLREALANLLDNALAYGGSRVTVVVKENPACLAVEDDGPGIPPEFRARVLDRFYRMPGTTGDGAGLGLAIVEEIATRHQAAFDLEAGPEGRGLRARLRFSSPTR